MCYSTSGGKEKHTLGIKEGSAILKVWLLEHAGDTIANSKVTTQSKEPLEGTVHKVLKGNKIETVV